MLTALHRTPNWLLRLVVVGVVLDLAVGGVLIDLDVNQAQTTARLEHVTRAARCWDRVLDKAVIGKTSRAELMIEAQACTKYVP